MTDEFRVARGQFGLQEFQVTPFHVVVELFALDGLFQHIHEVYRIGGDFFGVVVECLGKHLEGKAGRRARHALVDTSHIAVFLQRLGVGIRILQRFAVINAEL